MSDEDDTCLPNVRVRKRKNLRVILLIVVLAMLMAYSVALLRMGYTPEIMISVSTGVCALAVGVVRKIIVNTATPPQSVDKSADA